MGIAEQEPRPDDGVTAPPPAGAARGWRAGLAMLGVFLAAQATMIGVSVVVLLPFAASDPTLLDDGPLPPWPLLMLLVVPISVGALVAVAGTAWLGGGPRRGRARRELAIRRNLRDIGLGLVFGLGGLVLTLPAAGLWAALVGEDDATSAVGDAFAGREFGTVAAVVAFLAVWLIAPLGEEVLFRGVLWRALEHWGWNRWVVLAVTSLVFSVAHFELLRTPLLLVLSVPIGLARLFTGNLLACVVAHQVNNFLPAVALLLATTGALP